jgi:hypothetical protein
LVQKKVAKELAYNSTFGIFKKAYASGYFGVLLGKKNFDGIKRVEDCPLVLKKAYRLGEKIVNDFEKNKKYIFQNLIGTIISALILKRIMKKNLLKNKDGYMKAVYENVKKRGDL